MYVNGVYQAPGSRSSYIVRFCVVRGRVFAMCEALSSVHSSGIQYERPRQSDERSTIKKIRQRRNRKQALVASTEAMFYKRFTMDAPNKSNTHLFSSLFIEPT